MLFQKNIKTTDGVQRIGYNPRNILKFSNFIPFVHKPNEEKLKKLFADDTTRQVLCDYAAAVISQLHYRKQLSKTDSENSFIEILCRYFHSFIQGKGYTLIADVSDFADVSRDHQHYVLVIGCQTPPLYHSRVCALLDYLKLAKLHNAVVVFSGANPVAAQDHSPTSEPQDAITVNEAAEMKALFLVLKSKDSGFPTDIELTLHEESEAARTEQNIAKGLQKIGLSKDKTNHVVIVSSLFHLPRIGPVAEQFIRTRDLPVETLSLYGAESLGVPADVKETSQYIKCASFEMFNLIFQSNLDEYFHPRSY